MKIIITVSIQKEFGEQSFSSLERPGNIDLKKGNMYITQE